MQPTSPVKLTASKASELRRAAQMLRNIEPVITKLEQCTEDCSDLVDMRQQLEERIDKLLREFG